MILDLFSYKTHSSGDEWPEKLAELAAIFGEFDGRLYNRPSFEERLQQISPRASYWAKWAFSSTSRHPIRQVGNAVPPLLAASIGREIMSQLFGGPRQEHLFPEARN